MKIDKATIRCLYKSAIKRISQIEISGGLFISDSAIKYICLSENGQISIKASLRLPPHAVVGGKIAQQDIVLGALSALRNKINTPLSHKLAVILSLNSDSVYFQLFNLPQLAESSLSEAVDLNVQMISPIDIKTAYYSYQMISNTGKSSAGENEFISAFIHASIVDNWIDACKSSGFLPIAVEFKALSVVRATSELASVKESDMTLILDIWSDGMDIILTKGTHLYFDHSYPWKFIQGQDQSISMDKFQQILITETGKVMNFAVSKFNNEIKSILVNAEEIKEEAITILQEKYPSLLVAAITMPQKNMSASWLSAFGAAKRGLLLRGEDRLISLTPKNVLEEHKGNQIIAVATLWQKISIVVLCFLLLIFSAGNLFLRNVQSNAGTPLPQALSSDALEELNNLKKQANIMSRLIATIKNARIQENTIHPLLSRIFSIAGNIELSRLSFQGLDQPIILSGSALSPATVMRLQELLDAEPYITELQLPLASLITTPDGRTNFIISFKVTSLDF